MNYIGVSSCVVSLVSDRRRRRRRRRKRSRKTKRGAEVRGEGGEEKNDER
jgi:hypothetical protein